MTLAQTILADARAKTKKAPKYRNRKVVVDGIKFASAMEARRYKILKTWQDFAQISDLRLQVRYPLKVNGVKIADYVADFVYRDCAGNRIIEDAKGIETDVFRLKAKHMAAQGDPVTLWPPRNAKRRKK